MERCLSCLLDTASEEIWARPSGLQLFHICEDENIRTYWASIRFVQFYALLQTGLHGQTVIRDQKPQWQLLLLYEIHVAMW